MFFFFIFFNLTILCLYIFFKPLKIKVIFITIAKTKYLKINNHYDKTISIYN